MPNRLASETSPYLLQHQHNPVDWFPWGEAAFAEARRRGVPVFLSVGYSTCYWCHVMERQVFEDEGIARQMNAQFVNVKVDREERPDVDEHYMLATQVLTGQGGWPMSAFLTPDGDPFFAGTYFPPTDQHGRPGFPRVMQSIAEAWRDRRGEIGETVQQLEGILQRLSQPAPPRQDVRFDRASLANLVDQSASDFDRRFGGFGGAPKFPRETLLEMLLHAQRALGGGGGGEDHDWSAPLRRTLDAMADGGIRDHLGGGFHRYSTDAKWLVPHFEIMLYDQAMLAWCYAEAAALFGHDRYARVARGVLDFVLREMTDAGGAFYTAFDAEVEAKEGGNYVWTPAEVEAVLGREDAGVFNAVYGLDRGFNFADPHGPNPHAPDANVLFLADPSREDDPRVVDMRTRLLQARAKRPQPLLDTKILTSWNGLMVRALADAGRTLTEPRYVAAAEKAANWLLRNHRNAHGGLIRTSRDGRAAAIDGFLDDYVFLARGLTALHRATGNAVWHDHAAELADYVERRFGDADAGGYWFSEAGADALPAMARVRRKVGGDSPLPSGNGWAAILMLELDRPEPARRTIELFAGQIVDHVGSACALLEAAVRHVAAHGPVEAVAGAQPAVPASPGEEAEAVVEVTGAFWSTPQRLELTVRIADGFHLYAAESERATAAEVRSTHAAYDRTDPPAGDARGELRGEATFVLHFAGPASDAAVDLTLRYQACDESRCLMPVTKHLEVRPRP